MKAPNSHRMVLKMTNSQTEQQPDQPSSQMPQQTAQPQAPKVRRQFVAVWYEGMPQPRVEINGMDLETTPTVLRKLANDLERQYMMS